MKTHQYTPGGESCSDELRELREHWIAVVDIDQKSNESDIVGLELHLLHVNLQSRIPWCWHTLGWVHSQEDDLLSGNMLVPYRILVVRFQ